MNMISKLCCLIGLCGLMPGLAEAGSPYAGSAFTGGYYGGIGQFFNPYSFPPSTSVRTPPYFAVHPPVYYSTRHARPYGMSPFAAPPMVGPGPRYQGRPRTEPIRPVLFENTFCEGEGEEVVPSTEAVVPETAAVHASPRPRGPVRENPFVSGDQLSVANLRK